MWKAEQINFKTEQIIKHILWKRAIDKIIYIFDTLAHCPKPYDYEVYRKDFYRNLTSKYVSDFASLEGKTEVLLWPKKT